MTVPIGGLRGRYIRESIYRMLDEVLDDLGWYDTGSWFAPVNLRAIPVDDQEEIVPNVVALADDDEDDAELEMGSNLSEFRTVYYVDVYAENQAVGLHIARDLRDAIQGRYPSIGRDAPNLSVLDYSLATPVEFTVVDFENVALNRAHDFPKAWQRYWYSLYFEVVDSYADEDG